MIPVDQVRTGRGRGQCGEATIASLLEVQLDDVPSLWAGPDAEDPHPYELRLRLYTWLKEQHHRMFVRLALPPDTDLSTAYLSGARRLWGEGEEPHWLVYHRACGPNPDGVMHAVVCHRGVVIHDPNPSRQGIVSGVALDWLVPMEMIPEDLQGEPALTLSLE